MGNDGMRVIAAVARKGGSGKSTLVKALASAVLAGGKTALLVDTDPQGDLAGWFERAKRKGMVPEGAALTRASNPKELEAVITTTYDEGTADFLFIDTAGTAGPWADEIAIMSDVLVTPVVATYTDFTVGTQTMKWFRGLRDRVESPDDLPPHRVVISNFPAKPSRVEQDLLVSAKANFPVINNIVQHRNAYVMMDAQGFLGELLKAYQSKANALERSQARRFQEAILEATDVLNDLLGRE
jgi:chromosome partitioning protein